MSEQHQMALALFEELAPKDLSICDAPDEVGYNRSDVFLDLTDLSLAGRRAIDVAYFIVAQSWTENKYFTRKAETEYITYIVDIEFFKWLMSYTSNNHNHLRSVLRQGQKAAIEVLFINDTDNEKDKKGINKWLSVPLLGTVGFNRGQVYFQVHTQLEPYIKNPDEYHFFDLRFVFQTLRGRLLYDYLQPFVNNGISPWIKVDDLRKSLDCTTTLYKQYKYFNSRALSVAIQDINNNADLEIEQQEMLCSKGTRRVDSLRFVIKQTGKKSSAKRLDNLAKEYELLVDEFGLNRSQIYQISKMRDDWPEKHIERAVQYTRHQIQQGIVKKSAAGYLMKALKEGYALSQAMLEHKTTQENNEKATQEVISTQISDNTSKSNKEEQEGLALLQELSTVKQKELIALFKATPGAKIAAMVDKIDISKINTLEQVLESATLTQNLSLFAYAQLKKSPPK